MPPYPMLMTCVHTSVLRTVQCSAYTVHARAYAVVSAVRSAKMIVVQVPPKPQVIVRVLCYMICDVDADWLPVVGF